MGVNNLWKIVQNAGKPIRLEAMRKKRLAIDASIWVYQFLKAVRNKDGVGLRGSHIVGFFRRICKLLYHGVMPIFVFDGGAPLIKLKTIGRRRERREGQRQSAKATAQRLLHIKLQREAENYVNKSKREDSKDGQYFRKEDDFHLPEIDKFYKKTEDPRTISVEEYRKYMETIDDNTDDIDLDKIDPGSEFFEQLPLEKQYRILHKLRLKSRLRMGYSKEQFQDIFPNSLEFSKFQIQMVTKRNFLTQKLLHVVGLDDNLPDIEGIATATRRVAGEQDTAYTLQNNTVGWSMSLNDEGIESKPIELDSSPRKRRGEQEDGSNKKLKHEESEEDFSDIEWENVEASVQKPRENFSLSALPLPPATDDIDDAGNNSWAISAGSLRYDEPLKRESLKVMDSDDDVQEATTESLKLADKAYEEELKKAIEMSKQEIETLRQGHEELLEDPFEFHEESVPEKIQEATEDKEKEAPPAFDLGTSMFKKKSAKVNAAERPLPVPTWFDGNGEISNLSQFVSDKEPQEDHVVDAYQHDEKPTKQLEEDQQVVEIGEVPDVVDLDTEEEERSEEVDETKIKEDHRPEVDEQKEMIGNEKTEKRKELNELEHFMKKSNKHIEQSKADTVEDTLLKPRSNQITHYDYEEEEENELVEQIEREEESNEAFTQLLLNNYQPTKHSRDEIALKTLHNKELRDSDEVTDVMIEEVKDLLTCFGIPYITAPMEAEAQCAELLKLGLVDGIVTDDSDCFLFGGDKVYRHIFTEKKFAEFYELKDLEKQLNLSRESLIELAYLLGSDYTEGLKGIGPVMATKILNEFGNLTSFRKWCVAIQDVAQQEKACNTAFKKSLRKRLVNNEIYLDDRFPDPTVKQAYLQPEVDTDKTRFVWSTPDLEMLRSYLKTKVGWDKKRSDDVLIPLIRRINAPF